MSWTSEELFDLGQAGPGAHLASSLVDIWGSFYGDKVTGM